MYAHALQRARRVSAIVFATIAASSTHAATPVFTDHFNNGNVANSDTVPNFWNTIIDAAGTATEPVGGPLTLTATGASGGDQFPFTEIASPLQNSFNFFRSPIVLQASGLGYAPGSASIPPALIRSVRGRSRRPWPTRRGRESRTVRPAIASTGRCSSRRGSP